MTQAPPSPRPQPRAPAQPRPAPPPPAPRLVVYGDTSVGRVRDHNEDFYLTPDTKGLKDPPPPAVRGQRGELLIVADGMGGHAAGEVAARMTAEGVMRSYYGSQAEPRAALREAIAATNADIYHTAQRNPTYEGMGSTLVAALFLPGGRLVVANVGDSRLYRVREGRLEQMTLDHTWVAEKLRAREITPEEAANHERRNIITRAMGSGVQVQADFAEHDVRQGDVYLLCSDGLSNMARPDELSRVLTSQGVRPAVDTLIKLANDRGAPDNVTAIAAAFGSPALDPETAVAGRGRRRSPLLLVGLAAAIVVAAFLATLALLPVIFPSATPTPAVASPTVEEGVTPDLTPGAGVAPPAAGPTEGSASQPTPAPHMTQALRPTVTPTPAAPKAVAATPVPTAAPAPASLPGPQLTAPDEGWSAPLDKVEMLWEAVPGAGSYMVELSAFIEGNQRVKKSTSLEPRLVLVYDAEPDFFKIPGTVYTWKVAALDTAGRVGNWSGERTFRFSRRDEAKPTPETPKPSTPEPHQTLAPPTVPPTTKTP